MNKKYLSVLLFGAMIAASTSTFMSCKDYDDDIDGLKTEINENATTAASELASKVDALKSQISTLESAKDKLNTELAAARQEASTATANALSAAQKAQAAAEAAQKGGDQAAAAAAAAQQTADNAAKDLASAVARVATLETKVASLESAVADLKKADSDFSSRLATLENSMKLNQEAIATNKNGIAENKQAIADANAAILAKATELNSAINDLSVKIGAQIDVVNAELNTIKSNYATKDELNTKYQELVAMDAQLKNQIETNGNYISALQTTVKELGAKDTELAAKIESNYNTIIEKLNATNTELTAASNKIATIEGSISTLSSQYTALQSAKADVAYVDNINSQLTTLVNSLQSTLNNLSTSNAAQDRTIGDLLISVKALQEKTVDLQNLIDKNNNEANAALQAAVAGLQKEIADAVVKAQEELTEAVEDVKALAEENKEAIEQIKADLSQKADQSALDKLAADLLENVTEVGNIQSDLLDIQSDLAKQKSDLEGKIVAAETAAKEYADTIVRELSEQVDANADNIKNLQDFMEDLTKISGEDLSAFVTQTKLDVALDEFYEGLAQEFLGQYEFTEWVNRELCGQILSNYVTNDALAEQLAGYVTKEEYDQKIEELEKKMDNDEEGNEGFEQRIAKCESYLINLGLVNRNISKRLTSITLVPDHYIDGIEAITFRTLQYTDPVTNKLYVLSNNEDTKAVYRMNPSGVNLSSIDKDKLSYVANMATNTRASVESPIVVTGCELDEDGDLVVSVRKTEKYSTKNFADGENGKFWIAALSIPINKDYWTVEDENAVVYSEYTRLSENRFTPTLAKAVDTGSDRHLWSWNDLSSSFVGDKVYKELAYDIESFDLMELVSVCEDNNSHTPFTDYESYGLAIKFDIPNSYNQGTPATDQQKFAYMIDDHHIASCVYDGGATYTKNAAAIDREPIVRVRLVDTNHNNNTVVEKYFKIKWTKKTPVDLGSISTGQYDYTCGNYSQLLNTVDMNQLIYGHKDINMASATFHTIYPDANLKKIDNGGVGTVELLPNTVNGVTSYNLKWTVTDAEFHAAQPNSFTNDKELTVDYVWEAADQSGDIKFSMKMTVKAPSFGVKGYNGSYWNSDYSVFTMNPIVYGTDKAKDLCTINVDLVNNFSNGSAPATSMLDVITKQNFNGTVNGVEIEFDADKCRSQLGASVADNGKSLLIDGVVAATIENTEDGQQIVVLRETNATESVTYGTTQYGTDKSYPTSAAKELVGKNIPVKVVVDPCGEDNGYTYTAKEFGVKVINPFSINSSLEGNFYESRVNGSRINVANALQMTDWNGYVVALASDGSLGNEEKYKFTNSLYTYYDIKEIEWDTEHASTNIKAVNGNLVPTANHRGNIFPDGASFSYDEENNELVYKNNGNALDKGFVIYCPVKVTYKWGTVEVDGGVAITVTPGSGID